MVNITPGEILDEEFLKPMAITQYRLAKDLGVPPIQVSVLTIDTKSKKSVNSED